MTFFEIRVILQLVLVSKLIVGRVSDNVRIGLLRLCRLIISAMLSATRYIAKPLLARCLRRAQTLALSVVSRGFFAAKGSVARQSWKKSEKAGCVAFCLFTLAVVGSKICYVLSEQGLYFGLLRKVYDISKMYL